MSRAALLTVLSASFAACSPAASSGAATGGAGPDASGTGGLAATGGTVGSGGAGSGGSGTGGLSSATGGASSGGSTASGGAVGMGGTGGAAGGAGGRGTGGANAGGATGTAGMGGDSLCVAGKYVVCESFEGAAAGALPTGWTKHGAAAVATDSAARGTHALKVTPQVNGERRIYLDTSKLALGSGHWGRVFYRVQTPAPISCDPSNTVLHSTFVALHGTGPVNGSEEVRVVDTVEDNKGKHQWLYNVQPSGSEFGKGSPYNWMYDGNWHCAEWHIDNPTQSYHFYLDGAEVTQIAINNGAGNYSGSDIPATFDQVRIGLYNYQQACAPYLTVWLDELAMDPNRIGCGN